MTEQQIFTAALTREDDAERVAFLNEACAGDAPLRQRVESLLAEHRQLGSFMDVPFPAVANTIDMPRIPLVAECPGKMIGPYRLLQQIGEGGMGTVYMAEQTQPVQRKVALKVIKAGMDSRQVIARFEAERQALALMDHVNIARVLDAGATEAGRPYFVMELVHGVSIIKYCDDNQLTPRQRLELFVPVCQAIQHAHQKGIIHRDIKPSNVMVTLYDGKPVPKVIDFGVAKATEQRLTERTLFTQYGTMVGTLEYTSPEQAELSALGVDTRSDIYSLGVLLYELLTGSTPLSHKRVKGAAYGEVLRMIREDEPPKPSTRLSDSGAALASISAQRHMEPAKLQKLVRGELDWIVMKTLEKDRNRRYATANGFAADVQRYLDDEPVQAFPPSAGYRLRKFMRRNKPALVMVSVVTLAVLLVVGSIGWMARDRTAREQGITQDRTTRQELIKERVELALEEAGKRHQEGRWREAFDAAKRAEALATTGGSDEELHQRVREVLGDMQMLANLEDVRARSTANESGYDLKEEDSGNAQAFREYGMDIDSLDRDEAAKRIRARSIRYELSVFLDSWSHVRRRLPQRNSKQIGKDWRELLQVARAADPDPWRDRFRMAVLNDDRTALVELAASAPISSLPAETVDRLGDALLDKDIIKEAAAFLKKGQRLHPQDYWINVNLARCLVRLNPPQLDDAIRYYTAAVALRPEAAQSHANLGDALAAQGRLDEAVAAYRDAIHLKPNNHAAHTNFVGMLQRQGRLDEAAAAYREAIRLKPDDDLAHYYLGFVLAQQGKLDEAADAYREAIRLKTDYYPAHTHFVGVLLRQGRLDEATAACREAIRLNPDNQIIHAILGSVLGQQGKLDEAAAVYREAIRLKPNYPPAYTNLAAVLQRQGRLDEAIAAFRKAIEFGPKYADGHISLGNALRSQGKLDEAVAEYQEAAALVPNNAVFWNTLGTAHYRAGNWKAAVLALEKSRQLNVHYGKDSVILFFLSMAHGRLNEKERARTFYDQAAQWRMGIGSTEEELRSLCAEAAALLALEVPPTLQEPPVLTPGPTLLEPAAGTTLDSGTIDRTKLRVWEFDWSDVAGATQHHLYVIGSGAFPAINNPTLTSSSYRFEEKAYVADQNRLGWRWKVRAQVQGIWTDWSEERTFEVAPLDDNKSASLKK